MKKQTKTTKARPTNMGELLKNHTIQIKRYPLGSLIEGTVVLVSPSKILVDIGAKAEGIVNKDEMKDSTQLYKELKVGDKVLVMVIREENKQGYIELSIKRAEVERKWADLEKMYAKKTPLEAKILQYNKGGLICEALGMQCFIPISHLDRAHFAEISTVARGSEKDIAERLSPLIGKTIKAVIIELDRTQNRIVLSEKQVNYEKMLKKRKNRIGQIKPGDVVEGFVSGVVPFGLFVDLDGLEGLVHVSEIAWEKVENPINYFTVGDKIKAQVLNIDEEKGKVGLSVKRLQKNPWEGVQERYPENTKVKGKVTRVVPFGVFVELEPGLEALIHISEMDGELDVGQQVEALVTLVDPKEQKLGLSVRKLHEPQMIR